MKPFRLPKGINKVYFPFCLHDFSPWQEQIKKVEEKFFKKYTLGKSHCLRFEITNDGGTLVVTKR